MKLKVLLALSLISFGCNFSDPIGTVDSDNNGTTQNNDNNSNNGSNNGSNNATNNVTNNDCDPACENGVCEMGVCVCETGYADDVCGTCDTGYQDNDADGVCTDDCSTADCGNGTCDDASGALECTCDAGHVGDACDMCDVGFQDNDNDGICSATCDSAALDCSPQGVCDDMSGLAVCVCPAGTEGDGATCDVEAPDVFDGWTAYGAASVTPDVANFGVAAACDVASGVRGEYSLASPAVVGRLKARVSYSSLGDCQFGCEAGAPAIRLGDSTFQDLGAEFVGEPQDHVVEICLGDAYHGDVDIDLTTRENFSPATCDFDYLVINQVTDLEYMRVDPTSYDCPSRGVATNHDFEGPADGSPIPGWLSNGGVGEILTANNNSRMRLSVTNRCNRVSATSQLNIPVSTNPQAFKFRYSAQGAPNVSVTVGSTEYNIDNRNVVGDFVGCLPTHSSGLVEPISFNLSSLNNNCSNSTLRELVVDDIVVVDEPACARVDGLINGTFDDDTRGWSEELAVVNGIPSIITYPEVNGEKFLSLQSTSECSRPNVSQAVFPPLDGSINAVEVTYQLESTMQSRGSISLVGSHGGFDVFGNLPETGQSTATLIECIPKDAYGYPYRLTAQIGTQSGGGVCAQPMPTPFNVYDLKVINTVACQ